ncbi:MAG: hypothetical protein WD048_09045 [Chitinophagales bacterium]
MRTSKAICLPYNKNKSRAEFFKKDFIFLLFASFLCLSMSSASAAVYTASGMGNFNDENIWTPEYPGNHIKAGDTVKITGQLKLNKDVLIDGMVLIYEEASLVGSSNLIIMEDAWLINKGLALVGGITNQGIVYNKHIMETSSDFINSGKILNNESVVVGQIMENIGVMTGNGGTYMASNKMINAQGGKITGNTDVCSSDFMNINGGQIDSNYISFCGARIFNELFLTASIKSDNVILNLKNSENLNADKLELERSTNGKDYEIIASLEKQDLLRDATGLKYVDQSLASGKSLQYRMKITDNNGQVKTLQAIDAANIYGFKL